MGKYLHKFTSLSDFNAAYNGNTYLEPWVSYTTIPVPTKMTVIYGEGYGGSDITLEYQGPITLEDGTEGYLWLDENRETDDYGFFTVYRTIDPESQNYEYTDIIYLYYDTYAGAWDWNDGSFTVGSIVVLESESEHQVDYNKKPVVTYDLIIDASQGDECVGQKVTFASSRIGLGEEYVGEYGGNYQYYADGDAIKLYNAAESLKVKIINAYDSNYNGDYDVPLTSSDESGNTWLLEIDGSMFIEVHVDSLYSDGSAYNLKAVLSGGC